MAATFKVRTAADLAFNEWLFAQMRNWAGPMIWLGGVGAGVGIFAGGVAVGWHVAMTWGGFQ